MEQSHVEEENVEQVDGNVKIPPGSVLFLMERCPACGGRGGSRRRRSRRCWRR